MNEDLTILNLFLSHFPISGFVKFPQPMQHFCWKNLRTNVCFGKITLQHLNHELVLEKVRKKLVNFLFCSDLHSQFLLNLKWNDANVLPAQPDWLIPLISIKFHGNNQNRKYGKFIQFWSHTNEKCLCEFAQQVKYTDLQTQRIMNFDYIYALNLK